MKRFASFIAICMVLVLSFPSVPAFAANIDSFIIRAQSITPDYPIGTVVLNDVSGNSNYKDQVLDCLKTFDLSLLNDFDYYLITCKRSSGTSENGTFQLYITVFNSDVEPYIINLNGLNLVTDQRFYGQLRGEFYTYQSFFTASTHGSFLDATMQTNTFSQSYYYGDSYSGYGYEPTFHWYTFDANFPIYFAKEIEDISGFENDKRWSWTTFPENRAQLTDLFAEADGYNLQGQIISPGGGDIEFESNLNHMYFNSCDLGFAEPYGINDFSRFGGAYVFCRYSVDDWIVNHISSYKLKISAVCIIGSQQNNFVYRVPLDRNGIVTIPFSDLFVSNSPSATPIYHSFLAMVSSDKLNSDYNIAHLYSMSESKLTNWLNATSSKTNYNLTGLGWSLLSPDVTAPIKYIVAWVKDSGTTSVNSGDANGLVGINPFIIRLDVQLEDYDGNLSKNYAEKFDLYTGDSTAVDTGALTNDNPFIPEISDDNPEDIPLVPDIPNSTSPVTIIYNGGQWSGNLNGVIGFDPGYTELKNDLNSNPDGNFTQYLNPLKADEGQSWFFSFVNQMPPEMKSILVTGAGVGVLFGLFRFIRRG